MKKLESLLAVLQIEKIIGDTSVSIEAIAADSRKVKAQTLFFCIVGDTFDGHDFAIDAIQSGAVALIVERQLDVEIPQVVVSNARSAMSQVANAFYDYPSHKLKVIGVTGTNGKTSCTYIVRHLLQTNGHKCGLIGTVSTIIGDEVHAAHMTTPESLDLHRMLHQMVVAGCDTAVMEVSSHSLAMGRVENVDIDVAVFTNLSHDHLDFHKTVDDYRTAKGGLFRKQINKAVINNDDAAGLYMASQSEAPVLWYSCQNNRIKSGLIAEDIHIDVGGTRFNLLWSDESFTVKLNTVGLFNVYNALAGIGACLGLGMAIEDAINALASFTGVEGRFEMVQRGQNFLVIVDYAHTDDALRNILDTVNQFKQGETILVFGCGGDRDKTKRPQMGKVAGELADFVVVTSDNPRSEEPESIIADILVGLEPVTQRYLVHPDREIAIKQAISRAKTNDIVIIAGKGHETYQQIKNKTLHFDDREIAAEAIREVLNNATMES